MTLLRLCRLSNSYIMCDVLNKSCRHVRDYAVARPLQNKCKTREEELP